MIYIGIDHHRQYSHMTLMDREGQGLRSGRIPSLRSENEESLESREAMEAVLRSFTGSPINQCRN